jgi:mannose-6-phosphate isomerase-like protein (cupin superfamily)
MGVIGDIQILRPFCDLTTVTDGRGGIFTWIPEDPILEYNLLFFSPGKVRGNHFHPEFIEYFLVVDGTLVLVTRNPETGDDLSLPVSKGMCFRIPKKVPHVFHAITEATCISMLTKPWAECDPPIIHEKIT